MPRQPLIVDKTCPICAKSFRARRRATYCGHRCAYQANRENLGKATRSSFAAGGTPWNKGLTDWRQGYTHSPETREAIRKANSGENAPNWKGGITTEHYRIRRSAAYKAWRQAVYERDNYTCQTCGVRSTVGRRVCLEADHIKPFAMFPELRFEVSNGRTLCASCHRKTPTWGKGGRRYYAVKKEAPA